GQRAFAVDACHDGAEALALAGSTPYDLVILDLMLPRRDGFSVCRELRARRDFVPVLMLTARDAVEDRVAGLSEGADDYLVKPFAFSELLARIRALLRRTQDYKASVLRAADLELSPFSRVVTRGGRVVPLTGREYALLEYLMRNKGRVVTPTMILEHVWDMNYDGLSNIVNVYINHLRKKVDGHGGRRLIRTLRGQGYCLDDPQA
ncbi:MAG TPA: response regulator transcription factor, partial [Vicinamibacterales bacterium]|nr:response regulator transcription factor [Vicinamibacterales bacterium]